VEPPDYRVCELDAPVGKVVIRFPHILGQVARSSLPQRRNERFVRGVMRVVEKKHRALR